MVWDTNMAAVSLFWDTNMARRTSKGSEAFWLLVEFNASKFVLLSSFPQKLGQNHPLRVQKLHFLYHIPYLTVVEMDYRFSQP